MGMRSKNTDALQRLLGEIIAKQQPAVGFSFSSDGDKAVEEIMMEARQSPNRHRHDTLGLGTKIQICAKLGNENIFYSSQGLKVNRNKKKQPRVILITSHAFYNLTLEDALDRHDFRRRIMLTEIGLISIGATTEKNGQQSCELVLHVPSSYDYKYVLHPHQATVIAAIISGLKEHNRPVPQRIGPSVDWIAKRKYVHQSKENTLPLIDKKHQATDDVAKRKSLIRETVVDNIMRAGLDVLSYTNKPEIFKLRKLPSNTETTETRQEEEKEKNERVIAITETRQEEENENDDPIVIAVSPTSVSRPYVSDDVYQI